MNDFVVSALKYRPITFENVIGQNSITKTLENAIKQNQLPQALLFCGPRGVGKTTTARLIAKGPFAYIRAISVASKSSPSAREKPATPTVKPFIAGET